MYCAVTVAVVAQTLVTLASNPVNFPDEIAWTGGCGNESNVYWEYRDIGGKWEVGWVEVGGGSGATEYRSYYRTCMVSTETALAVRFFVWSRGT
ncbi:unnamed protein product [Rodentolepis nana]|uniref:Fibronectin type-III domain-containing protein n=1 Tax=Rodentolepis nana TaxID=102285 RepID=A0A0R3TM60_RODNA|nr:unnamed protein product [Rodentolepis nana]